MQQAAHASKGPRFCVNTNDPSIRALLRKPHGLRITSYYIVLRCLEERPTRDRRTGPGCA
eukprot:7381656-Prymnesium_polylepis.1